MKNIFYKLLILVVAPLLIVSCDDKDALAELNSNASVTANLSNSSVVLEATNADAEALTITWSEPDFGYNAAPSYTIYMDNAGDNFSKPEKVSVGKELQKSLTVSQLNAILLKLELEEGTPADVEVKVIAELGDYNGVESSALVLNASVYQDKLDLSTTWGVVGSATVNGWNGPDVPFYTTSTADVYVAYTTLTDGDIKFRQNNSWESPNVNYGDDNADGSLEEGGTDIAVTSGTYKITLNLSALTYTLEEYSLGITGSATPIGWPADPQIIPDAQFTYDSYSDSWKVIIALSDGDIKFRTNDSWDTNYGDTGADGTLESAGDNITVTAGNYIITVDLNNSEYELEAIDHIWGITGSGSPTGWPADPQIIPDVKFTRDFSTDDDIWVINSIDLTAGEIKFRADDSWDVNYGDTGADGTLESGGDNIAVDAGSYKITLDLSDSSSPKYILE
ncbi:SusE domain-containing protein [Aureibaculum luteum]|uniref:SusE domain-containing protein n=1 Tax=Aureibaculum luteum TaxID=1548456 RepID=UPI000E4EBFBD|nr:SusE domain-containing protein [Aureibaculum luteum]